MLFRSYAFREAGKVAEEQTPEYINAARQALFYILQALSNKGIDLWMIKTVLLGAQQAQTILPLPPGTVKILEANWRYLQTPQIADALPDTNPDAYNLFNNTDLSLYATTTEEDNYFGWDYQQSQIITQIGFNAYAPGGSATYNFVLETSNDGSTWSTAQTVDTVTLADKEWYYFQLNLTLGFLYYRLRETVATTVSLRAIQPS